MRDAFRKKKKKNIKGRLFTCMYVSTTRKFSRNTRVRSASRVAISVTATGGSEKRFAKSFSRGSRDPLTVADDVGGDAHIHEHV